MGSPRKNTYLLLKILRRVQLPSASRSPTPSLNNHPSPCLRDPRFLMLLNSILMACPNPSTLPADLELLTPPRDQHPPIPTQASAPLTISSTREGRLRLPLEMIWPTPWSLQVWRHPEQARHIGLLLLCLSPGVPATCHPGAPAPRAQPKRKACVTPFVSPSLPPRAIQSSTHTASTRKSVTFVPSTPTNIMKVCRQSVQFRNSCANQLSRRSQALARRRNRARTQALRSPLRIESWLTSRSQPAEPHLAHRGPRSLDPFPPATVRARIHLESCCATQR